jgi:hypothetical protein
VLRGTIPPGSYDKGRLKIPNAFKALVENQHGEKGVYDHQPERISVRVYPWRSGSASSSA